MFVSSLPRLLATERTDVPRLIIASPHLAGTGKEDVVDAIGVGFDELWLVIFRDRSDFIDDCPFVVLLGPHAPLTASRSSKGIQCGAADDEPCNMLEVVGRIFHNVTVGIGRLIPHLGPCDDVGGDIRYVFADGQRQYVIFKGECVACAVNLTLGTDSQILRPVVVALVADGNGSGEPRGISGQFVLAFRLIGRDGGGKLRIALQQGIVGDHRAGWSSSERVKFEDEPVVGRSPIS